MSLAAVAENVGETVLETQRPPLFLVEDPAEEPIRVLLVEDDPEAAQLAALYLTRNGASYNGSSRNDDAFELEWVANLFAALERLHKPGIDVVLLDLGLEELSGPKSHLAVARACGRGVPVVIFTADETMASQISAQALGASAYLVK